MNSWELAKHKKDFLAQLPATDGAVVVVARGSDAMRITFSTAALGAHNARYLATSVAVFDPDNVYYAAMFNEGSATADEFTQFLQGAGFEDIEGPRPAYKQNDHTGVARAKPANDGFAKMTMNT